MTNTQQYEWHTATIEGEGGVFHFASTDGEHWYGVSELPENPQREHAEQVAAYAAGTDGFIPMSAARRFLRGWGAERGETVTFHAVVEM